jgi:hypothetical protein
MTFHVEEIRLEIRGEAKVLARFGTSAADALEFKDRAREALRHIWGANLVLTRTSTVHSLGGSCQRRLGWSMIEATRSSDIRFTTSFANCDGRNQSVLATTFGVAAGWHHRALQLPAATFCAFSPASAVFVIYSPMRDRPRTQSPRLRRSPPSRP